MSRRVTVYAHVCTGNVRLSGGRDEEVGAFRFFDKRRSTRGSDDKGPSGRPEDENKYEHKTPTTTRRRRLAIGIDAHNAAGMKIRGINIIFQAA